MNRSRGGPEAQGGGGDRRSGQADRGAERDASETPRVTLPGNCSWLKGQWKATCQVAGGGAEMEARE